MLTESYLSDVQKVILSRLRPEETVLWLKLFIMAQYRVFSASQEELADALSMKRYTFKKHMTTLRNEGALVVKRKYKDGFGGGCLGATYQLVPVEFWIEDDAARTV